MSLRVEIRASIFTFISTTDTEFLHTRFGGFRLSFQNETK